MHTQLYLLPALLLAAALHAVEPWPAQPGIQVRPDGGLAVGGLVAELQHYDARWQATNPRSGRVPADGREVAGKWTLDAPWATAEGAGRLHQEVRRSGADGVVVEASLAGVGKGMGWALVLMLEGYRGSSLRIDGATVPLPAAAGQPEVVPVRSAQRVLVPLPAGGGWLELSGALRIEVQDVQKWGRDAFALRSYAGEDATVSVQLRLLPLAVQPLELGAAGSAPFRDEVAGDRVGGWTDQGDNDLRALPAGVLRAAGIPFAIGGGGMVLSAGRNHAWLPGSAEVPGAGRSGACLYLLHAGAWVPAGEAVMGRLRVVYADGAVEEREVRARRDLADWWVPPERLPNAVLGWSGDNPQARVGLFVSRHPIPERPLRSIGLQAVGEGIWMVAGMALGEEASLPLQLAETIVAGPRWHPVETSWEVEPGSALDLSGMTAAPLSGRLEVRGADLVDEGGSAVRLLGANLCFSANFPEKPLAERMARALRAMGHNVVRFHHMDGAMVRRDVSGIELDAERMDRLDYLYACCQREGLRVVTDVYISRAVRAGTYPEFPHRDLWGDEVKALVPLLPSALEDVKRFATAFLTHRNPYTGLTWGEDPALASLGLVNEDNYPLVARNSEPDLRALIDERFAVWLGQLPEAERNAPRDQLMGRWMGGLQAASCAELTRHVRSLGVRAPVNSANHLTDWWTMALRLPFDVVETHTYHDHPHFPERPWLLPFVFHQRGAVASFLRVPTNLAPTRRLDRPFLVTEINFGQPNHQRAEYAPAVAAVAGLQGWTGLWRFAFAHDLTAVSADAPLTGFDLCRDPIALLGERAMALMFRRGDVVPAPWSAALVCDPALAIRHPFRELAPEVCDLALHARIGHLPAGSPALPGQRCWLEDRERGGAAPAGGLPVFPADERLPAALGAAGLIPAEGLGKRRARSACGQVEIDAAAGWLRVATSRSVAAVLPGASTAVVGGVTLANRDGDPATVVVAALDGEPLASSRRLLVLHLTDAQNSGVRFGDSRHAQLLDWGSTPVLVRTGRVEVALPGPAATAYALDLRGARREQVALLAQGGAVHLDATVERPWGPCLAWEIVRPASLGLR